MVVAPIHNVTNFILTTLPSPAIDWKIWKALYMYGCLFWYCQTFDSSDVTLSLEDAQGIQHGGTWTVSELSLVCF